MEVSKKDEESGGQELVQTLVSLTGLPEPWVSQELLQILETTGQNAQEITLEKLREAMLVYLEEVHASLSKE